MMWKFSEFGDAIAFIDDAGQSFSYSDIVREENALAALLPERGLIFCLCTTTPGSMLGYVTALNARVVPLLLDENLDGDRLDNLINTYKPDVLWVPDKRRTSFKNTKIIHSCWGYTLLKTIYNHVFPMRDDLALLLTTSGSTGSPKLVRHTYKNLSSNITSIVNYLEVTSKERPISSLPMHYTYGLSVLNIHLHVGSSIILTEHAVMQRDFWKMFTEYEATSIAGVPYTYEMLHKLRFFSMDLPSLKSMNQAGGKMPPDLQREFINFASKNNKRFYVMYGQTEASPRMGYLPWEKAREKYGCMGVAIPGGSFFLIDVNGKKIFEPETIGELVYKGPNVTPGYAERGEDLMLGDERQGVLMTGDMAKRDADGYYTIMGRKKRFLKLFGNRVSLDECEQIIKKVYPDIGCVCAGVDNCMYIFISDKEFCTKVKDLLVEKTGIHHSGFKVKYLEILPISVAGKILYHELEQYYD